ncbi:GLPGLI family protein [Sphingobacterium rhinopitheci]|uniref:GLPGLI family protein n=1 Tax=Sphingobacterium rhinopitheci TaxID=2781960 RepID=UPI001F51864B|nr:GLPGLI family protein [Sphingobacterium rhinopitheci]MCI0922379.1 GLPGLI family protein [Sphingobacterium rhinopitheci]
MKNIKSILLLTILFLVINASSGLAQYAYFPYEGKISYDKTVFMQNKLKRYASYSKEENSKRFFEQIVATSPESIVLKKSLSFKGNELRFEQVKQEFPDNYAMLMQMGILESDGSTYQNMNAKESKSLFALGGQDILITDSLLSIKWKITDEYRNIAGYNCRRANGIALDSVYVVAFYTDEIPVSGGPASFRGLPGMILGVAVPELHFNMFATQVDLTPVPYVDPNLTKKKIKPMTRKGIYDQLNSTLGGMLGDKVFNLLMAEYFL